MSPAYIFTKQGVNIMALKSKTNETEEITLDYEAEYEEREYTTISGKELIDVHDWTKYNIYDLDVGEEMEGLVEVRYFTNKDKTYDSILTRVADDGEYVDLYINFPKPDKDGYITDIRKGYDFYRSCFDFIFSILRIQDEANVINADGEEINKFTKVNILNFAKFLDKMSRVGVKITEGNPKSDYNSWIIYKME